MILFPTELIGISYLAAGDETGDRRSERGREGYFFTKSWPQYDEFLGRQTLKNWEPF